MSKMGLELLFKCLGVSKWHTTSAGDKVVSRISAAAIPDIRRE